MGSFLCLKLETVSRAFSSFAKLGILEVKSRHVRILDVAALSRAVSPISSLTITTTRIHDPFLVAVSARQAPSKRQPGTPRQLDFAEANGLGCFAGFSKMT